MHLASSKTSCQYVSFPSVVDSFPFLISQSSGSGSGTQTRKSVKSKSSEQSANDIGSYDGEDNQRNAPLGKGSDDGSDIEVLQFSYSFLVHLFYVLG